MNDTRTKLSSMLTQYQRRTQGMPDIIEDALSRANGGFIPVRPQQTGSVQPQLSAAQRATRGFEAAAMQAADYPALAEMGSGVLGMVQPESYRGDPSLGGAFEAGAQRFREATPALDSWRGEVGGRTETALQAGVPMLGILGASALLGGVGPEDVLIGGARALRAPAAALRAGSNADEAIGAARTAARVIEPSLPSNPSSKLALRQSDAYARQIRDTTRMGFEELANRVDSGMELPKTGRAIPRVRLMDRAVAEQAAQEGAHLLRGVDGSYVGGPPNVKTPSQLSKMRERVDRYVDMGSQWVNEETQELVRGYDWYARGRAAIQQMAPDDPQTQRDLAVTLGIYSEARAPEANLHLGLREWNRYQLGVPQRQSGLPSAGTEGQSQRFSRYMSGDFQTRSVGNKTLPYSQQLDPTQNVPMHVSANDQIMGRVYGYAEDFDRGLSDSEHAFMDAEQLLGVQRANARRIAGRDDWTVGELQAAAWVGRRAEDLLNQGKVSTLQEGLSASADDFRAFMGDATVYMPNESTPGVPGVAEGYKRLPFDQRARHMSSAMRAPQYRNWADEFGSDTMARDLDLLSGGPVNRGLAGFWHGAEGLEMNPMDATTVLADFVPGPHGRELAPYFREALEEMVSTKAYVDAQVAGAAVAFVPMIKSTSAGAAGNAQTALRVQLGRALSQPEMEQVSQLASRFGWVTSAQGDGFLLFPPFPGAPGAPGGRELANLMPEVQQALKQAVPDARAITRGRVESVYEELPWTAEEGTGAATRSLEAKFQRSEASQFRLEKIDSPRLREKARAQLRFMRMQMDAGQAVRSDYVNALAIVSERGLRGLFEAAAKGSVPLPVLLAVWANQEMQAEMGRALEAEGA